MKHAEALRKIQQVSDEWEKGNVSGDDTADTIIWILNRTEDFTDD